MQNFYYLLFLLTGLFLALALFVNYLRKQSGPGGGGSNGDGGDKSGGRDSGDGGH